MNPFETETMADLCLRQGHRDEAFAIYRRLLVRSTDPVARERMALRISSIESGSGGESGSRRPTAGDATEPSAPTARVAPTAAPIAVPGVRARWSTAELTVEWRLPAEVPNPTLQLLLLRAGPTGVLSETREIDVAASAGLLTLAAEGIHSVRVAVGRRGARGFVPLARG